MLPPDVQVSLERIDLLSGKAFWTNQFDRKMRPHRCEVYTNGIVTFLFSIKAIENKVVFLDPKTGKPIPSFDTRHFAGRKEDPQIAYSGGYDRQESVEEERCEISLPNGWRSRGLVGLSWRNWGTNHVRFFRGPALQWTMILPHGAYNLAHWNDILIFRKYADEGNRIIDTLYAQAAGKEAMIWKFNLPKDIPDRPFESFDSKSDRTVNGFSYLAGKNRVFVYSGGTLFALDPKTGALLWRHSLLLDPVVKDNALSMDSAEIIESDEGLLLASENVLIRFDLNSKTTVAVLRKNLNRYGVLPIVVGDAVYCFTERP